MIESLPEDYEIHIYSCNKLSHRWHVALWKIIDMQDIDKNTELINIKCMTIDEGMRLMEEYLTSEAFKEKVKT
jgi:hypothetical protein